MSSTFRIRRSTVVSALREMSDRTESPRSLLCRALSVVLSRRYRKSVAVAADCDVAMRYYRVGLVDGGVSADGLVPQTYSAERRAAFERNVSGPHRDAVRKVSETRSAWIKERQAAEPQKYRYPVHCSRQPYFLDGEKIDVSGLTVDQIRSRCREIQEAAYQASCALDREAERLFPLPVDPGDLPDNITIEGHPIKWESAPAWAERWITSHMMAHGVTTPAALADKISGDLINAAGEHAARFYAAGRGPLESAEYEATHAR